MARTNTKPKKLPKGLAEFEASLDDLRWAEELLGRLLDLPENGLSSNLQRFREAMKRAEEAEKAAACARENARNIALRTWETAKANWTVAELQEATGYDDE